MSPRAYTPGTGLSGPGQDHFPNAARESARQLGLYPGEILIWRHTQVRSGGATDNTYTPDADAVRGRVDPTSSNTAGGLRGGVTQDETSEHLVTFENGQVIGTQDRLEIDGKMWTITSIRSRTDELVTRCEVRELP